MNTKVTVLAPRLCSSLPFWGKGSGPGKGHRMKPQKTVRCCWNFCCRCTTTGIKGWPREGEGGRGKNNREDVHRMGGVGGAGIGTQCVSEGEAGWGGGDRSRICSAALVWEGEKRAREGGVFYYNVCCCCCTLCCCFFCFQFLHSFFMCLSRCCFTFFTCLFAPPPPRSSPSLFYWLLQCACCTNDDQK